MEARRDTTRDANCLVSSHDAQKVTGWEKRLARKTVFKLGGKQAEQLLKIHTSALKLYTGRTAKNATAADLCNAEIAHDNVGEASKNIAIFSPWLKLERWRKSSNGRCESRSAKAKAYHATRANSGLSSLCGPRPWSGCKPGK